MVTEDSVRPRLSRQGMDLGIEERSTAIDGIKWSDTADTQAYLNASRASADSRTGNGPEQLPVLFITESSAKGIAATTDIKPANEGRLLADIEDKRTKAIVEALVREYLLDFDHNQVRKDLLKTMDGKTVLRPSDLTPELKGKLKRALEDGQLPAIAAAGIAKTPVPIIERLLGGTPLSQQETWDLLVCLNRSDSDRRDFCLGKLKDTSQTLGLSDKLGALIDRLRQIEQERRGGQPGFQDRLNELRAQFSGRDLNPSSTPPALPEGSDRLNRDASDKKLEQATVRSLPELVESAAKGDGDATLALLNMSRQDRQFSPVWRAVSNAFRDDKCGFNRTLAPLMVALATGSDMLAKSFEPDVALRSLENASKNNPWAIETISMLGCGSNREEGVAIAACKLLQQLSLPPKSENVLATAANVFARFATNEPRCMLLNSIFNLESGNAHRFPVLSQADYITHLVRFHDRLQRPDLMSHAELVTLAPLMIRFAGSYGGKDLAKSASNMLSCITLPKDQAALLPLAMDVLDKRHDFTGRMVPIIARLANSDNAKQTQMLDVYFQKKLDSLAGSIDPQSVMYTTQLTQYCQIQNYLSKTRESYEPGRWPGPAIGLKLIDSIPQISPAAQKDLFAAVPTLAKLDTELGRIQATSADLATVAKLIVQISGESSLPPDDRTSILSALGKCLSSTMVWAEDPKVKHECFEIVRVFGTPGKHELSAYAKQISKDHPSYLETINDISRMCDLGQPLPLPALLRQQGIGDRLPEKELNNLTDRLVARLGEDGVRQLLVNINRFNALNPLQQALVSQNQDASRRQESAIKLIQSADHKNMLPMQYGFHQLQGLSNELSKQQLDPLDVAIALTEKGNRSRDYLLGSNCDTKLEQLKEQNIAIVKRMGELKTSADSTLSEDVAKLEKVTYEGNGTSKAWLLLSVPGAAYIIRRWGPYGNFEKFSNEQETGLQAVDSTRGTLDFLNRVEGHFQQQDFQIKFSKSASDYAAAVGSGQRQQADLIALGTVGRYGTIFTRNNAPQISADLEPSGPLSSQTGIVGRNSCLPYWPKFSYGKECVVDEAAAIMRVKYPGFNVEYPLMQSSIEAIYTDPRIQDLLSLSVKVQPVLAELQMLFKLGANGEKSEAFSKHIREVTEKFSSFLEKSQSTDFQRLGEQLAVLRDAMPAKSEQRESLAKLCLALEKLDELKKDARFTEMIRVVRSGSFNADTLAQWARTDGIRIAAVLIAASIAVASLGQGTPLLVAALLIGTASTVGSIVGDQIVKKTGGSAYGNPWIEAIQGQPWQVVNGEIVKADTFTQASLDIVKHLGKDVFVNLILMGFGKFVTMAFAGKAGVAQAELGQQFRSLEKALRTPGLAKQVLGMGDRFTSAAVSQVQYMTAHTVMEESLKSSGVNEKAAGIFVSLLMVGGPHAIQGLQIRRGATASGGKGERLIIEHSFKGDREALIKSLQQNQVPVLQRQGQLFVKLGNQEIELVALPAAAANGKQPALTDKVLPVDKGARDATKPAVQAPEASGRLGAGLKTTSGIVNQPKTHERVIGGKTDAVSISSARTPQVLHPQDAQEGKRSVFSKEAGTYVNLKNEGAGELGMAIAKEGGGITFVSWPPTELVVGGRIPDGKFSAKDCVRLYGSEQTTYYLNAKTDQVIRVQKDLLGGEAAHFMGARVKHISADGLANVHPVICKLPTLEMQGPVGDRVLLSLESHSQTIGGSLKDDVFVQGQGNGLARIGTKRDGFFIDMMGGGRVEIQHENGAQVALSKGDRYYFKSGDRLFVGGREIKLKQAETLAFTPGAGTRNALVTPIHTVDIGTTSFLDKMFKAGFSYKDSVGKVPARVLDPSLDPILVEFAAEAKLRFGHLKGQPLMTELTKYVHDRLTPYQLTDSPGGVQSIQSRRIDRHAEAWDATGKPVLMGEIIARGSGVCLDQAVLVKYLADSMNVPGVRLQSGTYLNRPHAWVTVEVGGKSVVFDPRNHNTLTFEQRKGMPINEARDHKPFNSTNPRGDANRLNAQPVPPTNSSTINPAMSEFDQAVQKTSLSASDKSKLTGLIKNELSSARGSQAPALGELIAKAAKDTAFAQRAPELLRLLDSKAAKGMGITLDAVLNTETMPTKSLKVLADALSSNLADNVAASGSPVKMGMLRTIVKEYWELRETPTMKFDDYAEPRFTALAYNRYRDLSMSLQKLEQTQKETWTKGVKEQHTKCISELTEVKQIVRTSLDSFTRRVSDQAASESAPRVKSGGDQTEAIVFSCTKSLMNSRMSELRNKTPAEAGFLITRLNRTPLDLAGGDILLYNKNTGDYRLLDASQKDKSFDGLPKLRRDSVITSNWQDYQHLPDPLKAQKDDIASALRSKFLEFRKNGSPLNIHTSAPPFNVQLSERAWKWNETFEQVKSMRNVADQRSELNSYLNEFRQAQKSLTQFCDSLEQSAIALRESGNHQDAKLLQEYANHTRSGKGGLPWLDNRVSEIVQFQKQQK